jgi:hypothetical protein
MTIFLGSLGEAMGKREEDEEGEDGAMAEARKGEAPP